MNKLPIEVLKKITLFGATVDCWSLSRTCKQLYVGLNNQIYNVFKAQFLQQLWIKSFLLDIRIQYILDIFKMGKHVYYGEFVLNTINCKCTINNVIEIESTILQRPISSLYNPKDIEMLRITEKIEYNQNGAFFDPLNKTFGYKFT